MRSAGDDDMALPLCARTCVECTPAYSPHRVNFLALRKLFTEVSNHGDCPDQIGDEGDATCSILL